MPALLLATRNPGKIAEFRRLLVSPSLEIHTPDDFPDGPDVDETELTLEGNALLKARAWHQFTGMLSLADDTGLEVEALHGAPGVHSARYAGPEANADSNRALLLRELSRLSLSKPEERRARFRTVVAIAGVPPDDGELTFEGRCAGRITLDERGTTGFGYDSVFAPDGSERTFAEMSPDEKNAISHRAMAIANAAQYLNQL